MNFGHWGGPVVRECGSPTPATGIALLTAGKFTTAGDQHDGPQFICRIGHPLYANGAQYPTAAQDPCVVTPPASAYWSYWLAPKGANTWTYSTKGRVRRQADRRRGRGLDVRGYGRRRDEGPAAVHAEPGARRAAEQGHRRTCPPRTRPVAVRHGRR